MMVSSSSLCLVRKNATSGLISLCHFHRSGNQIILSIKAIHDLDAG